MLNQDAAESSLARCSDEPVDHLEPGVEIEETHDQRERRIEREAFREASLKMIVFMHAAFNFIHEAKTQGEMAIRFHAVSAAIDHPALAGQTHTEIARALGTTRANLSKHIVTFERQNDLPPTLSQKSESARHKYSEARKAQLNGN
jgi:hypothetical protein